MSSKKPQPRLTRKVWFIRDGSEFFARDRWGDDYWTDDFTKAYAFDYKWQAAGFAHSSYLGRGKPVYGICTLGLTSDGVRPNPPDKDWNSPANRAKSWVAQSVRNHSTFGLVGLVCEDLGKFVRVVTSTGRKYRWKKSDCTIIRTLAIV